MHDSQVRIDKPNEPETVDISAAVSAIIHRYPIREGKVHKMNTVELNTTDIVAFLKKPRTSFTRSDIKRFVKQQVGAGDVRVVGQRSVQ